MTGRIDHDLARTPQWAAAGAAGLLGGVAAYQVALAAGAPWGDTVYGGRAPTSDGVLDPTYRRASANAAVALGVAAWIVGAHGGVLPRGPLGEGVTRNGTRVLAGLLAVNTVTNLMGRHPVERWGMSSVTATASALCAVVLRSRRA